MSDERGWQPVRLVSDKMRRMCPTFYDRGFTWPEGKIVRVVKVAIAKDSLHPRKAYRVHPEDDWAPKGALLCEHQILAD